MSFDWRDFVAIAEQEAAKGLKWVKDGEAEKYTKPFYKSLGVQTRFPWCGAFLHWCLKESGCEFPISPFKDRTFALVQTWKNFAIANGLLVKNTKDLLPGDIVIFDWDHSGTVEHIGAFVRNFYDTHDYPSGSRLVKMFMCAEGNTNHQIHSDGMTALKKRNYSSINSVIRLPKGFVFPTQSRE